MRSRDLITFLTALGITALLVLGAIYFVREIWPRLPPALSVVIFILLAVIVIGYPIYVLGQWSNRYLARTQELAKEKEKAKRGTPPESKR